MEFLRGHQWESIGEVEAHLMTEDAARAGAGAIAFWDTFVEDSLEEV
jgi:hypothetical protein